MKQTPDEAKWQDTYTTEIAGSLPAKDGPLDVLVLLEQKPIHAAADHWLRGVFDAPLEKVKWTARAGLGCSVLEIKKLDKSQDAYTTCRNANILPLIHALRPRAVLVEGRALSAFIDGLKSDELNWSHFFSTHPDDARLWHEAAHCWFYPIPPIALWGNRSAHKETFEWNYTREQAKRAASTHSLHPPPRAPVPQYVTIPPAQTLTFFKELAAHVDRNVILLDIEMEKWSLDYITYKPYCITACYDGTTGYFIRWGEEARAGLEILFAAPGKIIVGQNFGIFDCKVLGHYGVPNARCDHDLMPGFHALNENCPKGLKIRARIYTRFGGYEVPMRKITKEIEERGMALGDIADQEEVRRYACMDVIVPFPLYFYQLQRFREETARDTRDLRDHLTWCGPSMQVPPLQSEIERLIDDRVERNFRETVMPSLPMIAAMEATGWQIDIPYVYSFGAKTAAEMREIQDEMHVLAGRSFNPNSDLQVAAIFKAIPGFKPRTDRHGNAITTETGRLSMDDIALKHYAKDYPIAKQIQEYRHISHRLSWLGFGGDNTQGLFEENEGDLYLRNKGLLAQLLGGYIYVSYDPTGTTTGRMASAGSSRGKFNAQNVEKEEVVRKILLPETDFLWGEWDYRLLEMMIASQLAGSGALEEAILAGQDVHCLTGSRVRSLHEKETTYEEMRQAYKDGIPWAKVLRQTSKTSNFALIYETSPGTLASQAGISYKEAQTFYRVFFDIYKEIPPSNRYFKDHARKYGYVWTLLGKKRRLPELYYSPNLHASGRSESYAEAERQSVNASNQGCLSGSTVIFTSTGPMLMEAGSLQNISEIIVKGENRQARFVSSGVKEINRYNFTDGSFLDATPDHDVKVLQQPMREVWMPIGLLTEHDFVIGIEEPSKTYTLKKLKGEPIPLGEQATYDIQILDGNPEFTANGTLVHNSGGQTTLRAMTGIHRELQERKMRTRLRGNTHDSILASVHKNEIEDVDHIMRKHMTQKYYENRQYGLPHYVTRDGRVIKTPPSKVTLDVEEQIGEVWGFAKSLAYWNTHQDELATTLSSINHRNLALQGFLRTAREEKIKHLNS